MATTYTYTNSFSINGTGINGATVNAYKASRFSTAPALNAAPPGGGADATTTTATTAGYSGAFAIALPTSEDYYVSVSYAGNVYWLGPVYGVFQDGVAQGGTAPAGRAGPALIAAYGENVLGPAYNADPTGATDSTTAFTNAMSNAVSSGSGMVYVPQGTYVVNHATTPIQGTGYLIVAGAGEGSTTLLTSINNTFAVLDFRMPGEVWDMTLAGGPTIAPRTDTATYSNANNTITDASILATDNGRNCTGTNIPADSYVGTVTPGVSFLLSSSATAQVNVSPTGSGSAVTLGPYTVSSSLLAMRNSGVASVSNSISRFAQRRITLTNIGNASNWLTNVGDGLNSSNPLVDEIIFDDVTLLGPSSDRQDAMSVTFGRRFISKNLRIIGCSRSPNVYGPLSVQMSGTRIDLTSATKSGNSVFVIDAQNANFATLTTAVATTSPAAPPIWRASKAVTSSPQAVVQPSAAATGLCTITGATPGQLTWNGATTPSLPTTATAGQIQTALNNLPGGAQIICSGGPLGTSAVTVTGVVASTLTSSGSSTIAASGGTGFYWLCTTGGTTNTTEPAWPVAPTNGSTVNDNGVIWTWNTGQTVAPVTSFTIQTDSRDPRASGNGGTLTGSVQALPVGTVLNLGPQGGPFTGWTSSGGFAGTTQKPVVGSALTQNGTTLTTVGFYPVDGGFIIGTLMTNYVNSVHQVTGLEINDRQFLETGIVSASCHPEFNGPNVLLENVKTPAATGSGWLKFNTPGVYLQQVNITNSQIESGIEVVGPSVMRISNSHMGTRLSGSSHAPFNVDGGTTANVTLTGVDADGGTDGTHATSVLAVLGTATSVANFHVRGGSFTNITGFTSGAGTSNPDIKDVAGYNPVGSSVPGTAFSLPSSTTPWTNATGVDGTLYVTAAGTVTAVSVNGVSVGTSLAVGDSYKVKQGGTFTLTYSGAPTIVFVGD